MARKSKENGRTFFDVISEYPRMTLCLILILISMLGYIVLNGNTVKVGGLEIGHRDKITHDTIIETVRDTIIMPSPKITNKNIKAKKEQLQSEVKQGSKPIEVNNQPANINTGNNNGIIGNNNTINLNPKEKPLLLNEADKQKIIKEIKAITIDFPKENSKRVIISSMAGNIRSMKLSNLIFEFLRQTGYQVELNAAMDGHIKTGVTIVKAKNADCVIIHIYSV